MAHSKGLGSETWRKARMRALVRDDFTCQAHKLGLCDQPCTENRLDYLHVHHIKERHKGGTHALSNLLTLCRHHHEILHPWMKRQLPYPSRSLAYPFKEL